METTIKLDDGRVFPVYDGEALSWSTGLYHTIAEAREGYPRMRAVIRAMKTERPEQLAKERAELVKGCSDRSFGHTSKIALALLDRFSAEES